MDNKTAIFQNFARKAKKRIEERKKKRRKKLYVGEAEIEITINGISDEEYSEIVYFHSVPPIPSVDILEMALNCINGLTLVRTSEHTINIPGDGRYSMGLILKYETIITIILTSWNGTGIHINTHAGNPASWTGWRTI